MCTPCLEYTDQSVGASSVFLPVRTKYSHYFQHHKNIAILGLVTQAFNPATWEVGQSSRSLYGLHSEFQASQDYIEKLPFQNKTNMTVEHVLGLNSSTQDHAVTQARFE